MSHDDYKHFLRYLYHTFVRNRVDKLPPHRRGMLGDEYSWRIERLAEEAQILRLAEQQENGSSNPIITSEALQSAVQRIRSAVVENIDLLRTAGFMDALDAYFEEIVAGMEFEDVPMEDLEVLRRLGFDDPVLELRGILFILKSRNNLERRQNSNELNISRRLEIVVEKLEQVEERLKDTDRDPESSRKARREPRRWFKGLGQIGQGAAMSIANISLAAGWLPFAVPPEARTSGAMASVTLGVGTILMGCGDLRGE